MWTYATNAYQFWNQNLEEFNREWEKVGVVQNLKIYPLKSAKCINVQRGDATPLGLRSGDLMDRSLVLFEESGQMVTGREVPKLTTISTSFTPPSSITLTALNGDSFTINLSKVQKWKLNKYKMRGDEVKGIDCGNQVAEWLNRVLGLETYRVRLVHCATNVKWKRNARKYSFFKFSLQKKKDGALYFDHVPFVVFNQASLDDVNRRITDKVSVDYFRPPIVVSGMKAWDEDNWDYIRIGGKVVFRVAKPREICVMTTIDPADGKKKSEHMNELLKYRVVTRPPALAKEWRKKPVIGMHCGIDECGPISVGDKVEVVRAEKQYWSCQ